MSGTVRIEKDGSIGWIVFDHPERRNAVSAEMWRRFRGAVEALAQDDDVRVVVLRGAGEAAFVSGADISEFESARSGGGGGADYDGPRPARSARWPALDKPLVAMIHGFCVGGGVALALSRRPALSPPTTRASRSPPRASGSATPPALLERAARARRSRARRRDPLHRPALRADEALGSGS